LITHKKRTLKYLTGPGATRWRAFRRFASGRVERGRRPAEVEERTTDDNRDDDGRGRSKRRESPAAGKTTVILFGNAPVSPGRMDGTTLIPTGGSDAAFAAVDDAIEVTAPDGTVHVLGVVEDLPTYERSGRPGAFDDDAEQRLRIEAAVERIETEATVAGMDCETAIEARVPSREIVADADEVDADAIVMGTRGARDAAGDLLGSTTGHVLRDASTTVASVPASA